MDACRICLRLPNVVLEKLLDPISIQDKNFSQCPTPLTFMSVVAESFGLRSNVSKSQYTLPNRGPKPDAHSKLSRKLHTIVNIHWGQYKPVEK